MIPRPLGQALLHPFARNRLEVLRGVDLEVPAGSVTGLLGPNGAGKTTLLRIMAATILPDRGQVRLLGRPVGRAAAPLRRQVGFVLSEERSFFWRLTARQNLQFFATLCDLERRRANRRIAELASLFQLQRELDKPFRDLSTGMRQRLSLARALVHDPAILLIDEPTRALDPGSAGRIRRLIGETLAGQLGKTVLLATHFLDEARRLCDRVAFLAEGRIAACGPADQVLERAGELFGEET